MTKHPCKCDAKYSISWFEVVRGRESRDYTTLLVEVLSPPLSLLDSPIYEMLLSPPFNFIAVSLFFVR